VSVWVGRDGYKCTLPQKVRDGVGKDEERKTHTDGQEGNRLIDSAQRRHINGLTTDGTLRADTGRVFTRTGVNDSIDENLWSCETGNSGQVHIHYMRTKQTWRGFWSVKRWIISKAWATMRRAMSFLPLLRPFIIRL